MFGWLKAAGDSIGYLVNLIALLAYLYGLYALWRAKSRYVQRKRILDKVPPDGTVALCIGIGTQVRASVEQHCQTHCPQIPIVLDFYKPGRVDAREVYAVVRDIRDQLQNVISTGSIRKALLFYGGPYSVATALGAIFDNWVPVDVYQFNSASREYEFTFTLDLETVKGI